MQIEVNWISVGLGAASLFALYLMWRAARWLWRKEPEAFIGSLIVGGFFMLIASAMFFGGRHRTDAARENPEAIIIEVGNRQGQKAFLRCEGLSNGRRFSAETADRRGVEVGARVWVSDISFDGVVTVELVAESRQ